MARFSRVEVINELIRLGLVPLFYHSDLEVAKNAIAACSAGGARLIEFTNRGDNAYRIFSDLVMHFEKADPSVILGVGSVLDPGTAALYMSSGANFIVGSVFNPEVAKVCNRRKVPYIPGTGSASEISLAEEYGAEVCKVFPGDSVGGPSYVKALLGPTPWSRLMPTSGVEATVENLNGWFKAGVTAVGMGSNLMRKEFLTSGNYSAITELTDKVLAWIRAARGQNFFEGIEHPGLYSTAEVGYQQISEWYSSVFGFKAKEGNSSVFLEGPGAGRIEVMKSQAPYIHLAVRVSNFEAAVESLRAKGIELEEPTLKPEIKAVYLKQADPLGNRIHLVWRK